MLKVVAFALIVSAAFAVIGKIVPHHHDPRAWRRIRHHDRVHFMRTAPHG